MSLKELLEGKEVVVEMDRKLIPPKTDELLKSKEELIGFLKWFSKKFETEEPMGFEEIVNQYKVNK